jgi:hypothetical protein
MSYLNSRQNDRSYHALASRHHCSLVDNIIAHVVPSLLDNIMAHFVLSLADSTHITPNIIRKAGQSSFAASIIFQLLVYP